MKAGSRHVGVSFCSGNLQVAEIEHGRHLRLLSLAQARTTLDLAQAGTNLTAQHPQVATMVKELGDLLRRNKIKGQTVSFALPSEPVFLNIVPLDPALKGKQLAEHLLWELRQHEPSASETDVILDTLPVGPATAAIRPSLLIAVRKGMVAFLQQAARQLKLSLRIVDVDHFSAEHTVRANYPEVSGHTVLQVTVRYSGVNVSTLHNGHLMDYRFLPLHTPDDVVRTLTNYIKHRPHLEGLEEPQAILIGGAEVPADAIRRLRAETQIQVIHINALRKLRIEGKIYEPFLKKSHQFAATIGLALRAPA
jgi:Tfp pilus assembly PilM family ATPase